MIFELWVYETVDLYETVNSGGKYDRTESYIFGI
jgi:hypothetical protein